MTTRVMCSIVCVLLVVPLYAQVMEPVAIADRGAYYEVYLDYTCGMGPYEMGAAYAHKIALVEPQFEYLVDSYLAERANQLQGYGISYQDLLDRLNDIRPQIYADYCLEVEGMATQCHGDASSVPGDGVLSEAEIFILNLSADVVRPFACSAVGVFGARSATGFPITARLLDYYGGAENQLPRLHAVVTINNGSESICMIGFLGMMAAVSAVNDDGVFAAILDSPTGASLETQGKASYPFDLRRALETCQTLDQVAGIMASGDYTFNHDILLSDTTRTGVLENNFSGPGSNLHRSLREDDSVLNPGVTWDINDAIACVNSFVLLGNSDNHTNLPPNYLRWNNLYDQLALQGDVVTRDELMAVASYDGPDDVPGSAAAGDVYHMTTEQIIVIQPHSLEMDIFFHPRQGGNPRDPEFVHVATPFVVCDPAVFATDMYVEPGNPTPGDQVTLYGTVRNLGSQTVDSVTVEVAYELDQDRVLIQELELQQVMAGGRMPFEVQWDTTGLPDICVPLYVTITDSSPVDENATNNEVRLDVPLPVELASFSALCFHNRVSVTWRTVSEVDNLGWNLYRTHPYGKRVQLNKRLIPGQGTSSMPHDYRFLDSLPDQLAHPRYRYELEAVSVTGDIQTFVTTIAFAGSTN